MDIKKKIFYKKGSFIYIEGDDDIDNVFIIEKGEVGFSSSNQFIKNRRTRTKPGDIIGFISSLSNHPRLESAIAITDSTLIAMSGDSFLKLLQKNSDIAIKIINYFANELRIYDNMMFPTEDAENALSYDDELYKLGKYYIDDDNYENAYYIFNRYLQLYNDGTFKSESRKLIERIESTGLRKISEPIKEDIYLKYFDKQIIFCENEPGDNLFIIKEGKVKIVKNNNNIEIMLSVLKEGDIFGELAIVSDTPRNATAISFGTSILLPITKDSLLELLSRSPEILKKIFRSISQRVWFTYIRLESKVHKNPITRIYAFLEDKLLEENISLKGNMQHTFNFGVDELFKMTDLTEAQIDYAIKTVLKDQNLSFNFGQTTVYDPSDISAKARFYRFRDNLTVSEDGKKADADISEIADVSERTETSHGANIAESVILKELEEID